MIPALNKSLEKAAAARSPATLMSVPNPVSPIPFRHALSQPLVFQQCFFKNPLKNERVGTEQVIHL
jgi:hypothetical protein